MVVLDDSFLFDAFGHPDDLTAGERTHIRASFEEWRAIRDCAKAADRARAERAVGEVYARSGRAHPQIVWCDSPGACAQWMRPRKRPDSPCLAPDLNRVLYPAVARERLHQAASGWLYRSQPRPTLSTPILVGLQVQLQENFADWDLRVGRTGTAVEQGLYPVLGTVDKWALEGQHGPYWLPGWSLARRLLGDGVIQGIVKEAWRDQCERLALAEELAQSCGWWFPFEGMCFVSERTCAVRRDDVGRLHAANRFAVEYSDGWGVCFWRGVQVPAKWIFHRDIVSPIHALTWPDKAQRVALTDMLGWECVLSELHASLIDDDPGPEGGTLFAGRLADGTRIHFLRGTWFCALRVPTDMKTARDAKRWTSSARLPGIRIPERAGCYRLLLDPAEAEATVSTASASPDVRMFDWKHERELTESGWRWMYPQVGSAIFEGVF